MALVLRVKPGNSVTIGASTVTILKVISKHKFKVRVDKGRPIEINSFGTRILPGVTLSSGTNTSQARCVIKAPPGIKISRNEKIKGKSRVASCEVCDGLSYTIMWDDFTGEEVKVPCYNCINT